MKQCCCSHINSHNQVRGHRTGSSHSGAEAYPREKHTQPKVVHAYITADAIHASTRVYTRMTCVLYILQQQRKNIAPVCEYIAGKITPHLYNEWVCGQHSRSVLALAWCVRGAHTEVHTYMPLPAEMPFCRVFCTTRYSLLLHPARTTTKMEEHSNVCGHV